MKKTIISSLFAVTLILTIATIIHSDYTTGKQVIEAYDKLPVCEKMESKMVMQIFTNKNDEEAEYTKYVRGAQYIENFGSTDADEIHKSIMHFYKGDDAGSSYLVISYPDSNKDDFRLAYLPSLRKPKKISGAEKKDKFMGSDFANGDIGTRKIEDYKYKLKDEEKIEFGDSGKEFLCYVVESVPKTASIKNETGYSKTISWLEKNSLLRFKIEFYDEDGALLKVMRLEGFAIKKNKNKKTVRIPTELEMVNVQDNTKTIINTPAEAIEVEENAGFDTDIFSERYLEKPNW